MDAQFTLYFYFSVCLKTFKLPCEKQCEWGAVDEQPFPERVCDLGLVPQAPGASVLPWPEGIN